MFIGAQHYLDCYKHGEEYKNLFRVLPLFRRRDRVGGDGPGARSVTQLPAVTCGTVTRPTCQRSTATKTWPTPSCQKDGSQDRWSCTPYCRMDPLMGEHFVSTESSNVVISNSFSSLRQFRRSRGCTCCNNWKDSQMGMHIKKTGMLTVL